MESDIQEAYNKRVFLKSLKDGKVPERKGLGKRLWLLCKFDADKTPPSTVYNNQGTCIMLDEPHKRLVYYKNYSPDIKPKDVSDLLTSSVASKVFLKYLGEYKLRLFNSHITIHYKKTQLISWAELDSSLMEMYPSNYRVDSNGFVHFKRNPITFIHNE